MAIYSTYISLFSGAGGLELAVRLALPAAQCVCYVEREVEAAEILASRIADKTLDDAPVWSDVSTFDSKPWRGLVDGIAGGFPCTNLSVAGKREGIQRGNASGLLYEYVRIVREVEPKWVYIENVPAVLAFPAGGIVLGELAALGFDAQWGTLRASDVGASHRRKRCFVLAYRRCSGDERRRIFGELFSAAAGTEGEGDQRQRQRLRSDPRHGSAVVAYSGGERWREPAGEECAQRASANHGSEGLEFTPCVGWRKGRTESAGQQGGPNAAFAGTTVDDTTGPRFRTRQCSAGGKICDGTWRTQPCGRCDAVADSGCDAVRRCTECTEEIGRRPRAAVAGSGAQLGHTDDAGLEGRGQFAGGRTDERIAGTTGGGMVFAPGPADTIWNELLVRYPELRPALSQAEAESLVRGDADGMASPLHQRIDRLRACGNGVVPVQGAAALRELVRRSGGVL